MTPRPVTGRRTPGAAARRARDDAGRFAAPGGAADRPVHDRRREAVTAAIQVLARGGARALTHREIDRQLDWPWGSASNYFRRRNDIFNAIAEQVTRRDIDDLAALEVELATVGPLTIARLVEGLAPLLEHWMSPAERDRAFARAEILFESTRNPEVCDVARGHIAALEALLCRTFVRLGSANPNESTQLLSVMMSSLHLSALVAKRPPNRRQLRAIIASCFTLSLEQVTRGRH